MYTDLLKVSDNRTQILSTVQHFRSILITLNNAYQAVIKNLSPDNEDNTAILLLKSLVVVA